MLGQSRQGVVTKHVQPMPIPSPNGLLRSACWAHRPQRGNRSHCNSPASNCTSGTEALYLGRFGLTWSRLLGSGLDTKLSKTK